MSENHYYILDDDGNPIATDVQTWGRWFEDIGLRRRIAYDKIGALQISTVFLGLNHQWGDGPPVLWETMVFGLPDDADEIQLRYTSKVDALKGHRQTRDEMKALSSGRVF